MPSTSTAPKSEQVRTEFAALLERLNDANKQVKIVGSLGFSQTIVEGDHLKLDLVFYPDGELHLSIFVAGVRATTETERYWDMTRDYWLEATTATTTLTGSVNDYSGSLAIVFGTISADDLATLRLRLLP